MKARVKATGKIVEVEEYHKYLETGWKYKDNTGTLYKPSALDFSDEAVIDYWTRLEHQYVGMAMQGMLSGWWSESIAKIAKSDGAHFDTIVHKANELAHALVEKLKEKEERK